MSNKLKTKLEEAKNKLKQCEDEHKQYRHGIMNEEHKELMELLDKIESYGDVEGERPLTSSRYISTHNGTSKTEFSVYFNGKISIIRDATEEELSEEKEFRETHYKIRGEVSDLEDKLRAIAYKEKQKLFNNTKPMTKEEFEKFLGDNLKAQSQYYCDCGPGKHEQDDHYNNGVSVVQMNVDLLESWMCDLADSNDAPSIAAAKYYQSLEKSQLREAWESSSFHFGMNGYEEKDANHYWKEP
jgi:hypothetical protein